MYLHSAPSNHLLEIKFQSKKTYQRPFFDLYLDVTFTNPNGKKLKVPTFWAGNNCWVVRYSSMLIGKHQFITFCSDADNQELHHIQGAVEVTAYQGDNRLLRHGAPIVASDKRHFCHVDGTPFFWLGDTWWLGLSKRLHWPDSFKTLANDRQKKGFTIVQIVAGLYPDMPAFDPRGESQSGFAWEKEFATIKPEFFDEADKRIMHLVSLGIVPCIVGSWGYYLQWLGTEKMKLHWRYLIARWGALPVVWVASGEQTMPWYLSNDKDNDKRWLKHEWSIVIQYMHENNGFKRMITTHPLTTARDSINDASLLNFDMQQTGHDSPTVEHAMKAASGWSTQPAMPVISGESRYEALAIVPAVTTADTRKAFWAHLLNSGCAGHTYGVNGVWQVNLAGNPFGQSPNGHDWGTTPWDHAMQLPGSTQLSLAKKLLLTLPWHKLEPIGTNKEKKWIEKSTLISFFKWWQQPVAAAKTPDNALAIYYTLGLQPFSINLFQPNVPVNVFWFDPTNGNITLASTAKRNPSKFTPPGYNADNEKDWVLVMTTDNIQIEPAHKTN